MIHIAPDVADEHRDKNDLYYFLVVCEEEFALEDLDLEPLGRLLDLFTLQWILIDQFELL